MLELVNGAHPESIPGVCFRKGDKIIEKDSTYIDNLDTLPFPARELVGQYHYRDSPVYSRSENHATILFSRGCVYRCIFCDHKTRGKVRFRSVENILEEVKQLYGQGITDFRILDEFFSMNRPLTKAICEGIIKNEFKITWNCQTRADALDEELLSLMKKAGCWGIELGVETGSPEVMKKINKILDLKKAIDAVRLLRKHGIFSFTSFMLGFPFETEEDMKKTITFAAELDPDMATFSVVTPFPATELWEMSGLDSFDETTLKELGIYSNKSYFFEDGCIKKIYAHAIRTFYFRPKAVCRLLKEACFNGSLKRRLQYLKTLAQGTSLL